MDYAVVRTGGKQYRVSAGDLIDVEKLPVEEGAAIELSDVLLLSQDGKVTVGTPLVSGAKVLGRRGGAEEGRQAHSVQVQIQDAARHQDRTPPATHQAFVSER